MTGTDVECKFYLLANKEFNYKLEWFSSSRSLKKKTKKKTRYQDLYRKIQDCKKSFVLQSHTVGELHTTETFCWLICKTEMI